MIWEAGGQQLSGTDTRPAGPARATILALHGGGYSAGYWDNPLDPDGSLVRLGPRLGYRVVAVDRPGYGAAHGLSGQEVRTAQQAQIVLDLIRRLRSGGEAGAGVFLAGHSMGAVLALEMAAADGDGLIAGLDISGLPFVYSEPPPDRDELARAGYLPPLGREFRRRRFYGPEGSFDSRMLEAEEAIARPIPAAEVIDAVECGAATPGLAARITVPVQITRAEFEPASGGGPAGLERCGALFTAAPRVVLAEQRGSGHNISLSYVARAYHLRAIAFFDEVLAGA